jgi:hypothetical protein
MEAGTLDSVAPARKNDCSPSRRPALSTVDDHRASSSSNDDVDLEDRAQTTTDGKLTAVDNSATSINEERSAETSADDEGEEFPRFHFSKARTSSSCSAERESDPRISKDPTQLAQVSDLGLRTSPEALPQPKDKMKIFGEGDNTMATEAKSTSFPIPLLHCWPSVFDIQQMYKDTLALPDFSSNTKRHRLSDVGDGIPSASEQACEWARDTLSVACKTQHVGSPMLFNHQPTNTWPIGTVQMHTYSVNEANK